MTKLKNTKCDKTQNCKLWKTQIHKFVTKLRNLNCEKTKKTQIVTKLKKANCDQTLAHKLWLKYKKMTKLQTQILTKVKSSNGKKLKKNNFYKTQQLKLWQNSKTPIVMKLKKFHCDNTQKLKLWQKGDSIWKHQEKHDDFFLDFWPKKSNFFDILVIKTFFKTKFWLFWNFFNIFYFLKF